MFERYTDDARKVILLARYESSRLGSSILQTEHLWLALLRENKRLIKRLAPQITVEAMHQRVLSRGLHAERVSMTVDMPLSEESQRVLVGAMAEADRCRNRHVTSEHLVNALLTQEASYTVLPGSR